MNATGADASFTHQDAAQLAADGVKAIGRYCPGGSADPGKTLTKTELDTLLQHGIAVWLVYELTASRWQDGYPAGRQDGNDARLAARAIGWPDDRPIYTGFDTNVGPLSGSIATAYQRGFNDGQMALGAHAGGAAYGDGYVLRILTEQHLILWKWLSDSTAFTESTQYAASGQASIVQLYGRTLPGLSGIDVDDLLAVDFGQYPAPAPTPQPEKQMEDVWIGYVEGSDARWIIGAGTKHHITSPAVYDEWKAQAAARGKQFLERPCTQAFLDDLTTI